MLQVLPAKRQTLLFSATMTRSLVALQAGLSDAFHFQVPHLSTLNPNIRKPITLLSELTQLGTAADPRQLSSLIPDTWNPS